MVDDYLPGRAEATLRAMSLMAACQQLNRAARLDRQALMLVRSSADDKRVFTLEKLTDDLTRSIAAGTQALNEVLAALKGMPQFREAAE